MSEGFFSRGFRGRRQKSELSAEIPRVVQAKGRYWLDMQDMRVLQVTVEE